MLAALSGCTLLGNRVGTAQPSAPASSAAPASGLPSTAPTDAFPSASGSADATSQGIPRQLAIRLQGETQVWNGNTNSYETASQFTKDGQLFLVKKPIGGGTAFAIQCGELLEEKAGAMLFATNTAALADIPAINRQVVDASIDVAGMDLDDPAVGRFHATVNQVMARAVTALYFQIRDGGNYPPKQILAGTVSLQLQGSSVSGEIALDGADFVGGARPVNRYLATITSP
jgi:hypothetical protein